MVDSETLIAAVLVWMERQPENNRLATLGTLATLVLSGLRPAAADLWIETLGDHVDQLRGGRASQSARYDA